MRMQKGLSISRHGFTEVTLWFLQLKKSLEEILHESKEKIGQWVHL